MAVRVVTLWIGPRLGRVERACLRSMLRQGHEVALYCYRRPAGVPDGIDIRDAASILPESTVIRHRSGSVSLFSNRFRYELQRHAAGTWTDVDSYLISPLPAAPPHLFGRYDERGIATGVLRFPPDSPLLSDLLEPFAERTVPPWLGRRARVAAWWRLRRTGSTLLADMPWGTAGPRALTAVAARHGLANLALPPDVFNPVHWDDAAWILDPSLALEDVITPRTVAIHLWNEVIKSYKELPAPQGSFLARLQAEGA